MQQKEAEVENFKSTRRLNKELQERLYDIDS